jgi:hypothetical protein
MNQRLIFFKTKSITVTAEVLAHAHNPGFRDFCAPVYARIRIIAKICILTLIFRIFSATYQFKKF